MTKKIVFLVLIYLMFLSCGNDDVMTTINDGVATNCMEGILTDSSTYQSNCPIVLDSSKYCEKIFIESPIYLEEENKYWISQFCSEIDDVFYYSNGNEDTILMTIIDKRRSFSISTFAVEDECEDERELRYVFQSEKAKVISKFSHLEGELKTVLLQKIEVQNGAVKNAPRILMNYNKENITYVPMDFNFDVGSFGILDTIGIEYIETLEIDNEVFFDVYTDNKTSTGDIVQVFYNKSYGIVSFIDKNNVQWKLNRALIY